MNYTDSNPACLDLAFVFASLDNLSGCFLTDPLFKNVSGNWYLSDGSQGDFGEIPVTYNHSGSLAGLIYSCISEYCESPDPNLGGCGDWDPGQPQYYSITNQSILEGTSFDTGACSGINNAVNPDIGGVGVLLSYLIQAGIIVYLWAAIRLLQFLPHVIRVMFTISARIFSSGDPRTRAATSRRVGRTVRTKVSQQLVILKSILVEFQEAQCFFMVASQAATIISLSSGPIGFNSTSLLQLGGNLFMALQVAATGVIPVIFALWSIYNLGMNSWYILIISTVTFAMATVSWKMGSTNPAPGLLVPVETSTLDQCGFYGPPLMYCGGLIGDFALYTPFDAWVVPFWVLYSGLLTWQIVLSTIVPLSRKMPEQSGWSRIWRWVCSVSTGKWMRATTMLLKFLIELGLFLCAFSVIEQAVASFWLISSNSWGFGQIVAVTIWAPVIGKYFYWTLFGTESYSGVRVSLPYKIVKDQDNKEAKLLAYGMASSHALLSPSQNSITGNRTTQHTHGQRRTTPSDRRDSSASSSSEAV